MSHRTKRAARALLSTIVGSLLISCSGPAPEPREYPRLPATGGESVARREMPREPLRDAPLGVAVESASRVVTIRVVFEAGSASDPAGREGLTHLTARLMAEGGAGELDYAALSQRLYPMAGDIGVHVGRDQTAFVGTVHVDHLEAFYELYRDVLLRPRLQESDFGRVRDQARNALSVNLRNSNDERLGQEALQAFLYRGHPYGHPVLGTSSGLARVRLDDVRAHRSRVFCAGRALVGVAGRSPDGFAARVERDLAALSSDACVGRQALPEPPRVERPRVVIVHKPSADAVAVSMGFSYGITRAHADYPALMLVAAWLGQHRQFVGRLMQAIRGQRGLNYGDYAYAEHFTQAGWSRFAVPNDARRQQYFSIWLRPLRPETAHFAIRLAVRELRRLASEGLDEAELTRIRGFATRYFQLNEQTASRRLGVAIDERFHAVEGDDGYLARLQAAWAALSLEQLNAAIRRHVTPDALTIAVVAGDAEQLAAAMASDAPSPITYRSEVTDAIRAEDAQLIEYPLGIDREHIRIVPVAEMFE